MIYFKGREDARKFTQIHRRVRLDGPLPAWIIQEQDGNVWVRELPPQRRRPEEEQRQMMRTDS